MTTGQLLDVLRPEIARVFSSRAYRNSQGERILLIDMTYPDDIDPTVVFIREHAPALTVDVISLRPYALGRRIVVSGFSR